MATFRNLREVLGKLKREKLVLKLCPRCGSHNMRVSSGLDAYPRMFGITPLRYICENCGYQGPIAMELEERRSN